MKNAKPEDRSAFLTSFLSFEKMTAIRKKSEKENKTKLMIKQKNISPDIQVMTETHCHMKVVSKMNQMFLFR